MSKHAIENIPEMADDIKAKLEALRNEGKPFPAVLRPHQEYIFHL